MRRIASKVHQQVSRLLSAGFMKTPVWYQAVLDHPPLPLPPRRIPQRTSFDMPPAKKVAHFDDSPHKQKRRGNPKHFRAPQTLPKPIEYLEDCVRRQFFRDRPFEAFRAKTLVEDGTIEEEHIISGKKWVRLRQRGRVVLPEDAVRFAVHLHEFHGKPLTLAYVEAVRQYDALRSENNIMSRFALLEARAHGAQFSVGTNKADSDSPEVIRGFGMEQHALETWSESGDIDSGGTSSADIHAARKRWKVVAEPPLIEGNGWTGGKDYIKRWRLGAWPDYERRPSKDSIQLEDKPAERLDWKDMTPASSAELYR